MGGGDELRRWARDIPALRGPDRLRDLVAYIRQPGHPAHSDHLLSALTAIASTDILAARSVLQALIPGLRLIAISRVSTVDAEDIDSAVIASAWKRIRRYPHDRRPTRIAANIVSDTRKDLTRQYPSPRTSGTEHAVIRRPRQQFERAKKSRR